MVSQYLALNRIYFTKCYHQCKLWPHLSIIGAFLYLIIFTTEEHFFFNLLNISELIAYIIIAVVIMFTLQHCQEELDSKWLIKFRSMPINYLGDFFAAFSAFALYGFSIVIILYCLTLGLIFGNHHGIAERYFLEYKETSVNITQNSESLFVTFKEPLRNNQTYATKAVFLDKENKILPLSSQKWIFFYGKGFKNNKEIVIKSKRISHIGDEAMSFRLKRKITTIGGDGTLGFFKFYVANKNNSFLNVYSNAMFHLCVKISLAVMLTLVLGRKFSLEIVLFCLLGLFSIQYLVQSTGTDVINEFVTRVNKYGNNITNFKPLWWEQYMIIWAKYLTQLEKIITQNYTQSPFTLIREGLFVESPLSLNMVQKYGLAVLISLALLPLMYRREV